MTSADTIYANYQRSITNRYLNFKCTYVLRNHSNFGSYYFIKYRPKLMNTSILESKSLDAIQLVGI